MFSLHFGSVVLLDMAPLSLRKFRWLYSEGDILKQLMSSHQFRSQTLNIGMPFPVCVYTALNLF